MRILKAAFAVLLAALLLLSAAACGNATDEPKETSSTATESKDEKPSESAEKAAGTYKGLYTKFVGDEEDVKNTDPFTLVLNEDGTGEHNRDDNTYKLTWKQDGDEITMTETFLGVTIDYNGTLKDGKLSLFNGEKEDPFTCEYVYEKEN